MALFDMHCDTMSRLYYEPHAGTLAQNSLQVDLGKLTAAESMAQVFALCLEYPFLNESEPGCQMAHHVLLRMLDFCHRSFSTHSDGLSVCLSQKDLAEHARCGKISAVLAVEGGGPIDGKIERLEAYYESGIRLLTLSWNYETCIGFPHSSHLEMMRRGLKPFGKEVIAFLNQRHMLIDVSHLSDGGFWDVLALSTDPVIASHSNSRSLSPHSRNLSDAMIKALADKGGVMGINFYPPFLSLNDAGKSRISDMVRHIRYIIDLAGADVPAIGTDFDGMSGCLFEINSCAEIDKLLNALNIAGLHPDSIEKIWYKNALRAFRAVLPAG